MTSVKSNDTVMGGTAESAIDRLNQQLRSDIKVRFKRKTPVEWPGAFYETPFLFFFAEIFRKVCSLRLRDRVVAMEGLKSTFSEIENQLRSTAHSLEHQVQGQDPTKTIRNLRAALKCREKIDEMNLTQEAVKSGRADKYLAEHIRELKVRLAQEASTKTENHAAVNGKQDSLEPKGQAPAKQTNIQAPQPDTQQQEVHQAQNQRKETSQPSMRGGNTAECKELNHAQLNAQLRLSTGEPSRHRNMKQRRPKSKPDPGAIATLVKHQPFKGSPLRNVMTVS